MGVWRVGWTFLSERSSAWGFSAVLFRNICDEWDKYDFLQYTFQRSVDNIKETVKKFKKEGTPRIFKQRLGGPESVPFYMYDMLDIAGFHIENGQVPTNEEGYEFVKNWLFIDFKKD